MYWLQIETSNCNHRINLVPINLGKLSKPTLALPKARSASDLVLNWIALKTPIENGKIILQMKKNFENSYRVSRENRWWINLPCLRSYYFYTLPSFSSAKYDFKKALKGRGHFLGFYRTQVNGQAFFSLPKRTVFSTEEEGPKRKILPSVYHRQFSFSITLAVY